MFSFCMRLFFPKIGFWFNLSIKSGFFLYFIIVGVIHKPLT